MEPARGRPGGGPGGSAGILAPGRGIGSGGGGAGSGEPGDCLSDVFPWDPRSRRDPAISRSSSRGVSLRHPPSPGTSTAGSLRSLQGALSMEFPQ
ncbi:serine/arginine-rich splicing factor 1-like [Dermochelys coriacea]|uniref:serine/arginine-rich splicing factor 1-like n=1 Tax=Dermochelys coriacea TaxID=27794 RepID=UPI001CA7DF8A|nr:serine/arginine-rich splicing factor 1-like [Dermochelys coriacea]